MGKRTDETRRTALFGYACFGWSIPVLALLLTIVVFNAGHSINVQRTVAVCSMLACIGAGFLSLKSLCGIKTGWDAVIIVPGAFVGILLNLCVCGIASWCLLMAGVQSFG